MARPPLSISRHVTPAPMIPDSVEPAITNALLAEERALSAAFEPEQPRSEPVQYASLGDLAETVKGIPGAIFTRFVEGGQRVADAVYPRDPSGAPSKLRRGWEALVGLVEMASAAGAGMGHFTAESIDKRLREELTDEKLDAHVAFYGQDPTHPGAVARNDAYRALKNLPFEERVRVLKESARTMSEITVSAVPGYMAGAKLIRSLTAKGAAKASKLLSTDEAKAVVEAAGGKFRGVSEGFDGSPWVWFDETTSGSTGAMPLKDVSKESIAKSLEATRAAFKKAEGPPPRTLDEIEAIESSRLMQEASYGIQDLHGLALIEDEQRAVMKALTGAEDLPDFATTHRALGEGFEQFFERVQAFEAASGKDNMMLAQEALDRFPNLHRLLDATGPEALADPRARALYHYLGLALSEQQKLLLQRAAFWQHGSSMPGAEQASKAYTSIVTDLIRRFRQASTGEGFASMGAGAVALYDQINVDEQQLTDLEVVAARAGVLPDVLGQFARHPGQIQPEDVVSHFTDALLAPHAEATAPFWAGLDAPSPDGEFYTALAGHQPDHDSLMQTAPRAVTDALVLVSKLATARARGTEYQPAPITHAIPSDTFLGLGLRGVARMLGEHLRAASGGLLSTRDGYNVVVDRFETHATATRWGADTPPDFYRNLPAEVFLARRGAPNLITAIDEEGEGVAERLQSVPGGLLMAPWAVPPTDAPSGLLGAFSRATVADLEAGGARRELAMTRLATGGAVGYTLFRAAEGGLITGVPPQDPKLLAKMTAAGWRPHSIKVAGAYISYAGSPLEPVLSAIATAADLGVTDAGVQWAMAVALGRGLTSTAGAQTLGRLVGLVTTGRLEGRNPLADAGPHLAEVRRLWEPINTALAEARRTAPGHSPEHPARRGPLGEVLTRREALGYGVVQDGDRAEIYRDLLHAGFDPRLTMPPRSVDGADRSAVLQRVPVGTTSDPAVTTAGVTFTDAEYAQLLDIRAGLGLERTLRNLVRSGRFQTADRAAKHVMLREEFERFTRYAVQDFLDKHPVMQTLPAGEQEK